MQLRRSGDIHIATLCGGLLALSGCGGGGGYSGSSPTPSYSVSVTVAGLSGTGLVLANNGGSLLSVTNNGVATFGATISSGSGYNVTVATQPTNPSQTCVATNNVGTASSTMVNVAVNCTVNNYVVGGSVTGLAGTGLVLENNYGNALPIAANGNFAFSTQVASNGAYEITVASQPTNPGQLCTVSNNTGAVTNAAIAGVTINCVTQVPRYAFSLNYYGGSFSIYNLDVATGQPRMRGYAKLPQTPIMGVSTSTSTFSYFLSTGGAQSPLNLPVLSQTNSYLSAFRNDLVTGAKLEVPGSPLQITGTLGLTSRLSIHPNDKFLYVTDDSGANKIWRFAIDSNTGSISALGSVTLGGTPSIVTFNRQGTFAFVANRTQNEIDVFSVDGSTGGLTQITANTISNVNTPYGVGLSANGRLAFVVNVGDSTASVFSVDNATGKLTAAPGGPFPLNGTAASDVQTIHPSGKFVYFRNGSSGAAGSIAGFSINQANGALTALPGSPYAIGVNSVSNLFNGLHPNGKLLYVANQGIQGQIPGSISAFAIDPATGALTSLAGIPSLSPAPYSVSVDPSGKFLYAASVSGDQILSYTIDSGGGLTPLVRSPSIRSGAEPLSMQAFVAPNSVTAPVFKAKAAYVANGDGTISNYTVTTTGALTTAGTTTTGNLNAKAVATSQGSSYAYAINALSPGAVSAYAIDPTSKALTLITATNGTQPTGTNPASVAVDPTGRFVYVANNAASGSISRYTVNKSDGTLVPAITTTATIANPVQVAVDPTGRNLFVLNGTSIQVFWIDNTSGAISVPPTPVFGTGVTALAGAGAAQLAIDPRSRFLYVANPTNGGSIEIYSIDTYGGVLAFRSLGPSSKPNVSIAVDPTGRYLYTADSTAKTISSYVIDQITGALIPTATLTSIATAFDSLQIAVDYAGNVVHAVLSNNKIVSHRIIQSDGSLDPASLTPGIDTGSGPGPITTAGEVE